MKIPTNKMCPMTQGERPCLGSLCMWFNEPVGECGVIKPIEVAPVVEEKPKTTRTKAAPSK